MAGKKYKLTFTLANGETQEIVFEVPPGEPGPQGIQGIQGVKGEPGATPYIGDNGNWWVAETDTGVGAVAAEDIEAALDEIIAIQNSLMGGGSV